MWGCGHSLWGLWGRTLGSRPVLDTGNLVSTRVRVSVRSFLPSFLPSCHLSKAVQVHTHVWRHTHTHIHKPQHKTQPRLPASLEQLEEERHTGQRVRQGGVPLVHGVRRLRSPAGRCVLSGGRGRNGHVAFAARACRLACPCVADVPCTWVRCCLVFSVFFGNTT